VDADTLGLAHVLCAVRADVTYPGDPGGTVHRRTRPPCPVQSTDTKDDIWIPIVAARGWSIITRDAKIRENPAEKKAVQASGAKLFAVTSDERLDKFHLLEVVLSSWRRIEEAARNPGPFIYSVSRTTIVRLPFD
jgi:hypothetical protein